MGGGFGWIRTVPFVILSLEMMLASVEMFLLSLEMVNLRPMPHPLLVLPSTVVPIVSSMFPALAHTLLVAVVVLESTILVTILLFAASCDSWPISTDVP